MTEEQAIAKRAVGSKASVISRCSNLDADKGQSKEQIVARFAVKNGTEIDYAATLDNLKKYIADNGIKEKRQPKKKEEPKKEFTPFIGDVANAKVNVDDVDDKLNNLQLILDSDKSEDEKLTEIASKIAAYREKMAINKEIAELRAEKESHLNAIEEIDTRLRELNAI
mgnify:CR=1 FL=1